MRIFNDTFTMIHISRHFTAKLFLLVLSYYYYCYLHLEFYFATPRQRTQKPIQTFVFLIRSERNSTHIALIVFTCCASLFRSVSFCMVRIFGASYCFIHEFAVCEFAIFLCRCRSECGVFIWG